MQLLVVNFALQLSKYTLNIKYTMHTTHHTNTTMIFNVQCVCSEIVFILRFDNYNISLQG